MRPIKSNYKQWRRKLLAAIRAERAAGFTPRRGSKTTTRPILANELRARRRALLAAELATDGR